MSNASDDLAKDLVLNHLSVSLGPKSENEFIVENSARTIPLQRKKILTKRIAEVTNKKIQENSDNIDRRVIMVLGAGASYGLHKAPLANEASEIIKNNLKLNNGVAQKLFDVQIQKLVKASKHNEEDFETQLLACSILHPQETSKEVERIYKIPYTPSLGYEIIAHLFKQRFVDAIIDFNFDELLDEAIRCELPESDYYRIISDGDVPNKNAYSDYTHRWDRPLYIKPHGTISHLTSLKFTDEHYYSIDKKITKHIGTLTNDLPVTIWCIGFGMQSFEFNQILEEATAPNSKIIFMDIHNPIKEANLKGKQVSIGEDIDSNHLIRVEDNHDLDDRIETIWNKINNKFNKKPYKLVSITRHKLLVEVFKDYKKDEEDRRQLSRQQGRKRFILMRFYLELAIAIAKAKGVVNVNELSQGRPGYLFNAYIQKSPNFNKSLYMCCREFGLKKIGYSRAILKLVDSKNGLIQKEDLIKALASKLHNKISKHIKHKSKSRLSKILKDRLIEVYNGREVEVTSKAKTKRLFFRDPILIPTFTSLYYYTRFLIENLDWDVMLSIAETGEWLTKEGIPKRIKDRMNEKKRRKICIITARGSLTAESTRTNNSNVSTDDYWEKKLNRYYSNKIEVLNVPWLEHNHHMTIFLKKVQIRKNGKTRYICKPLNSIFFMRRLQSPHIEPLLLNSKDSYGVLDAFVTYRDKANPTKDNLGKIYKNSDIKKAKNDLKVYYFGENCIWEKINKKSFISSL